MPKIDFAKAVLRTGTVYPDQFKPAVQGREKVILGDVAGLTQFGVNLTRLKPGAASALRHWHEIEDEFVFVVEGELMLVENDGETLLKAGDAAGFKAGVPNGHHLINKSGRDAVYLEIGTRAPSDHATYPDDDLDLVRDANGKITLTRKNGEPYR
jgi:uncharacterized cupin superfamily protein